MGLWTLIFILLFAGLCAGTVYLTSRIRKFKIFCRIDNRKLRTLSAFAVLAAAIAAVWFAMGAMNAIIAVIHLTVFWLLSDLIFFIIGRRRKEQLRRYYSGVTALLFTFLYLAAGFFCAYHVWATDYTVQTEKMSGELRIVQFADSHVGTTFDGKGLEKHIDSIQKLDPDIVVITGDYVDESTSKQDMADACSALGKLKTAYGVYFAFGNHDKGLYSSGERGYGGEELIAELEKNNVTVLQDESVLIDDRFYIIGRQDRSEELRSGGRASMRELVSGLDKSKYMIVLDHQPNDYAAQAESEADLVLSGHTHGGQLFPLTIISRWVGGNDRVYGYESRGNTNFIVTSGISDWAIKFKTGCRSEYTVIDVKGN